MLEGFFSCDNVDACPNGWFSLVSYDCWRCEILPERNLMVGRCVTMLCWMFIRFLFICFGFTDTGPIVMWLDWLGEECYTEPAVHFVAPLFFFLQFLVWLSDLGWRAWLERKLKLCQ